MNKIVCIFVWSGLMSPLFAQVPNKSCCELTAKVETALPGDAVTVRVVVKNISSDLVTVDWGGSDDIRFAVLKENGLEEERTEYGKRLRTKEMKGSMRFTELDHDAVFEQTVILSDVYLLKPGVYNVIILRRVVVKNARIELTTKATVSIP